MQAKSLKNFARKHNLQVLKEKSREPALPFDLFKQGGFISFVKVLQGSLNKHHVEFYDYTFSKSQNDATVLYQYSAALLNADSKMPDFSLLKKLKYGDHMTSSLPETKAELPSKFRLYGKAAGKQQNLFCRKARQATANLFYGEYSQGS